MNKYMNLAWLGVALMAMSAAAQTGTIPLDDGTPPSGMTNSNITVSNGSVGIGTTAPSTALDVYSGMLHVEGLVNPTVADQGAYIGWNALNGGTGETDIINSPGGGTGGIAFMLGNSAGTSKSTAMFINGSSNVGIGTTNPAYPLDISTALTSQTGLRLTNTSPGGLPWLLQSVGNATNGRVGNFEIWRTDTSVNVLTIQPGGNVGIGTTNPGADLAGLASPPAPGTPILEVNGDIALTQGNGGQMYFADGTVQATAWTGALGGGDYAESVDISGDRTSYEPGDLLVIDKHDPSKFVKSSETYSTMVAGVYSTKPGAVGRRQTTPKNADEIPMAVVGIVPARVSAENGAIEAGDLLVSSSTPGVAMKGTDRNRMLGAVVGKAMGTLNSGTGVIEVLVTLQ